MELLPPYIEDGERASRSMPESDPPKGEEPATRSPSSPHSTHSGPIYDDLPDWRPPGTPRHHIYQQYFTPSERRRLKAIPENDVTSEIQLLRVLLARSFAQVPHSPTDKKRAPLPLKLNIDLLSTFSRVAIVIGGLVGLHTKMHKSDLGDIILQALRELNPDEDLE